MQGPEGGTRVSIRSPEQLYALGDVVEAAGFVETYQGASELAGSLTRRKSAGKPVVPVDLSLHATLDPGEFDGRLVRIRGEFRSCIWCLYELGRHTGDLDNELRRLARIKRQWSRTEAVAAGFQLGYLRVN